MTYENEQPGDVLKLARAALARTEKELAEPVLDADSVKIVADSAQRHIRLMLEVRGNGDVPPELENEWLAIGVRLAEARWFLEGRAMREGKFKIPADQIRMPESFTDEELDNLAPVMIKKFVVNWLHDLKRLKEEAKADAMDDAALRMIRQQLKDFECSISRWAKRLGDRMGKDVQANLQELERLFRQAGDDLLEALNTPPEQRDPADWWLNDPDNPPPWEEDNE